MIRQYYEQGAHVVLVDMGNSYQGLCELIREKTHGEDGVYITYTEQCPITFNPFYSADGTYDIEKKEKYQDAGFFRFGSGKTNCPAVPKKSRYRMP